VRKKKPGHFGRDDRPGAARVSFGRIQSCCVTRFVHDGKLRGVVYHVYILASANGVLYTGVTNSLERRVLQHEKELLAGFTKRYGVKRLVYFEGFSDILDAISREKQIKGWRREKRLALIRTMNPKFRNLSEDFH
jgi:putative endonuclease